VIAMVRIVYVVNKGAVDASHPVQNLLGIAFAEFSVEKLPDVWFEQMFKLSAAIFLATHRFFTHVSSMISFSCDSWSFFSRS
jgi:hypothetical protein